MSSASIERIKLIRKKERNGLNGFGDSIPIGTDGLLVDMLSGLDLEEELKLGNNHSATIILKLESNITEIEEKYYDESGESIKFSVLISIIENINGSITVNMKLFKGAIIRLLGTVSETNLLHTKITTISNEVINTENKTRTTQIELEVDKE